jgi:restriction system protein
MTPSSECQARVNSSSARQSSRCETFGQLVRPSLMRRMLSRAINALRLVNQPAHRRRIGASRRVLSTLRSFTGEAGHARAMVYLRTVDPVTYEEIILSSLEDAGALVLRNRRYTGDGGIDGRCWFPGCGWRTVAIQCKRYSASVTPAHAAAFCAPVRRRGHVGGLYVHCGRTGPASYQALRGSPVALINGQRLLQLVLQARLWHG